jgi:hypothetical protein
MPDPASAFAEPGWVAWLHGEDPDAGIVWRETVDLPDISDYQEDQ